MGSLDSPSSYSIPKESQNIFLQEILHNTLLPPLPPDLRTAAQNIHFTGSLTPSIPINWRFAESVSALKALEASLLNLLRNKKYNVPLSPITINTDQASLFIMSPFLAKTSGEEGETILLNPDPNFLEKLGIKNTDLHHASASLQRVLATNIYRTRDGRDYHVHGSMDPEPSLRALGMEVEGKPGEEYDVVAEKFGKVVGEWDSKELDEVMNEKWRQAGTIAYDVEEFAKSEHGKTNAHVGLYEISKAEGTTQPPSWWPENETMPSSPKRPLAGLKVVDLTRVIASPAITRSLAEMGASVMRVTSPHVTDMHLLHQDLNWGKWNSSLHLKTPADLLKLIELIKEADVVVEGYRPGVMEKYGLGRQEIFDLVKDRGRGIIHVKENCYGWHGPWKHRSGWQQISDACCGVSLGYGRAMGLDEAVTPVFPNSDYCTGVIGSAATLHALLRRAEEGGSYGVDVSLNYYSQWLTKSVGEYPKAVWNDVWERHGKPVFRHYHAMSYTLPRMLKLLHEYDEKTLLKPEFFEKRRSKALGFDFMVVKPIAQFGDDVQLGYNVGTRGNGVDAPIWPEDLGVEVVE